MDPRSSPWTRLAVVAIYAAAMALVEAMVVYYLRRLFALQYSAVFTAGRFSFPRAYLRHEQLREAATIVMLLAVAFLAGRGAWQKVAYFLFAFGVWDIGYYVVAQGHARLAGLAAPPATCSSHARRQWWAPVWEPLLASVVFVVAGCALLLAGRGGDERRGRVGAARRGAAGRREPATPHGRPAGAARRHLQHPQRDRLRRSRLVAPAAAGDGCRPSPASTPTSSACRRSTAFSSATCCAALPGYEATGAGRTDGRGRGERCAVLYRRARLALDELDDALVLRHARPARFDRLGEPPAPRSSRSRASPTWPRGRAFGFADCHLEGAPAVARHRSAAALAAWLDPALPWIVAGDLNAEPDDEALRTLLAAGAARRLRARGGGARRGAAHHPPPAARSGRGASTTCWSRASGRWARRRWRPPAATAAAPRTTCRSWRRCACSPTRPKACRTRPPLPTLRPEDADARAAHVGSPHDDARRDAPATAGRPATDAGGARPARGRAACSAASGRSRPPAC